MRTLEQTAVVGLAIAFSSAGGCGGTVPEEARDSGLQEVGAVTPLDGNVLPEDQATAIANRHFGRREDAGCYVEDCGTYYLVSPPYIRRADIMAAAVYIDKRTGELHSQRPEED